MAQQAHWFLRVPFAAVFLYHGVGKLANPGMAEMMQMPLALFLLASIALYFILRGADETARWATCS